MWTDLGAVTEFNSDSIWKELRKEEESLRSQYKSIVINKKKDAFWRKLKSSKQPKQNENKNKGRWNTSSSKVQNNQNNKDNIKIKSKINSIRHGINLLKDNESPTNIKLDCLNFIDEYLSINEIVNDIDSKNILKCLIEIFVSPKEILRSLSIDIIYKYIGKKWNFKISIKYIIPIIVHCILGEKSYEKSEEIRLKFLNLIEKIIFIAEKNENDLTPIW